MKNRADVEKERIKRQGSATIQRLTPIKIYLLAYNVISTALWLNILIQVILFILTPKSSPSSSPTTANTLLSKLFPASTSSSTILSFLPSPAVKAVNHLTGSYDYRGLGTLVKWTQTLAVMEVIHSALGLVKSPVGTTLTQVFSRLWAVWGVVEMVPETHSNPLYTTMILAWSITEVIRYPYYATVLLGKDIYLLNWLRYTAFLPLYPLGASSEAFLSYSTLPPFSNLPLIPKSLTSILTHLPPSLQKAVVKTSIGRNLLWKLAQAGINSKNAVTPSWGIMQFARLVLFFGWWPALYILYVHMLKQRRKFFSKGKTVGLRKTQ